LGSALADVTKRARLWEGEGARPPEKVTACEGRRAPRKDRIGEEGLEARRARCPDAAAAAAAVAGRAMACKQHKMVQGLRALEEVARR
jgi:hypothetical protein